MRLKEIRERNGMTTRELGKRLGVGGTTITNWETGLRRPNIDMVIRMVEIFGCTADYLLGIERKDRAVGENEVKEKEDFAEIARRRVEEARRTV